MKIVKSNKMKIVKSNKMKIVKSNKMKIVNKEMDNFNFEILNKLLNNYINYTKTIDDLNINLDKNAKIRRPNFPSEISENIVKYAINKKYKIMPVWKLNGGDLTIMNKKIEVKGFSKLEPPSSFGPTEKWDTLYFVDCCNYIKKHFQVYEIKLNNNSKIFRSLQINYKKRETFENQCNDGKRPRISFLKIQQQLTNKYCKLIFNDNINKLI